MGDALECTSIHSAGNNYHKAVGRGILVGLISGLMYAGLSPDEAMKAVVKEAENIILSIDYECIPNGAKWHEYLDQFVAPRSLYDGGEGHELA